MKHYVIILVIFLASCSTKSSKNADSPSQPEQSSVALYILGTVQDGGSPHVGCQKSCCAELFNNPDPTRKVVSLGLVDHQNQKSYLFEATPDMTSQLKLLKEHSRQNKETPDGVFVTHAHIGHYTGLMYLGREALGGKNIPVYAMPRMKKFLETNGPWEQLVSLKNIDIRPIKNEVGIQLTPNIKVVPFTVPHRDEYSETVGYRIIGPNKSALFIPDIDKWSKWEKDILKEIQRVDYAFLDATFFDGPEINSRNIAEIPHPFVVESMELFHNLPDGEKSKVHFIHFNHTNALLNQNSDSYKKVLEAGFRVSAFDQKISL
ncbi:MBL fold metallo-hydrolase [Muricauda sp. 334s03]|uniref:MBL fold metallo-hydrolase n=1 Tax=Flagellimonas yonaguniensis TaxID=3031325 RepID=A0ABT5XXT7_9FLAO|nr:MBL fold metallo-hydrolase [[Muricauda] yonaguniensis]MDF0716002.1 MBL fold metallo-hydrolase [[Muricauda] yonaguniensis]